MGNWLDKRSKVEYLVQGIECPKWPDLLHMGTLAPQNFGTMSHRFKTRYLFDLCSEITFRISCLLQCNYFTRSRTNLQNALISKPRFDQLEPRLLFSATPQTFPYIQDFESGLPDTSLGWEINVEANTTARTRVVDGAMVMDSVSDGVSYDLNEAILKVNLLDAAGIKLIFEHSSQTDDQTVMPDHYIGSTPGDGVSISNDGVNWYVITNADDLNSTNVFEQFSINLDQEVDRISRDYDPGFAFTENFLFKFQQYDNFSAPTDGRAWDNIMLVGASHSSVVELTSIGDGSTSWHYPISTFYHDARTTTLYRSDEIGGAGIIESLSLEILSVPGQPLDDFVIRMRATQAGTALPLNWLDADSGWSTVYSGSQQIESNGIVQFIFDIPYVYDGNSDLLIDFSHDHTIYTSSASVAATDLGEPRSLFARSDSNHGDPLEWGGDTPTPNVSQLIPNIDLVKRSLPYSGYQGTVYSDTDGNNTISDGDQGVAGVAVYLDLNNNGRFDILEEARYTAITSADLIATGDFDESGTFHIDTTDLVDGSRWVRQILPDNWRQLQPTPPSPVAPLYDPLSYRQQDFLNRYQITTLTGFVWDDDNRDGIRDDIEVGLPDISVYLDSNNNGQYDAGEPTTTTSSNQNNFGSYSLTWLGDQDTTDYTLRVVRDRPYTYSSTPSAAWHDVTDSFERTDGVYSFGLYRPKGVIQGYEYTDLNENQRRDRNLVRSVNPNYIFAFDVSDAVNPSFPPYLNTIQRIRTAFKSFTQSLIDRGLGDTATISIASFASDADWIDMDPATPGIQVIAKAGDDLNGNGTPDVIEALDTVALDGDPSNYKPLLQLVNSTFTDDKWVGRSHLVLISASGSIFSGDNIGPEIEELDNQGIRRFAFTIDDASFPLSKIREIDDEAAYLIDPASLYDNIATDIDTEYLEPGRVGSRVFLDNNANGVLDWHDWDGDNRWDINEGEAWVWTQHDDPLTDGIDESGLYRFDNVPTPIASQDFFDPRKRSLIDEFPAGASGGWNEIALSHNRMVYTGPGYVHIFDASTESFLYTITPSDPDEQIGFGLSVAAHQDTVAIGAPGSLNTLGSEIVTGAVYLYYVDSETNAYGEMKIQPDDAAPADQFGRHVQLTDGVVVVASPQHGPGAVYLFDRQTGQQIAKIMMPLDTAITYDSINSFAIAVSGNDLVVRHDQSLYVYDIADPAEPVLVHTLSPDEPSIAFSGHGQITAPSIDVHNGVAIVQAVREEEPGFYGPGYSNIVYLFDIHSGEMLHKLVGGDYSNSTGSPNFSRSFYGHNVAIFDRTAFIGGSDRFMIVDVETGIAVESVSSPDYIRTEGKGFAAFNDLLIYSTEAFDYVNPRPYAEAYRVRDEIIAGHIYSNQDMSSYERSLGLDQVVSRIDFGYINPASRSISGLTYEDFNGNGKRDRNIIVGDEPDVVVVIDVSGSTNNIVPNAVVGDYNGDGLDNTVLDVQLEAIEALNSAIIARGLGQIADISLVFFGGTATSQDMNPVLTGFQSSTNPSTDADFNGVPDVIDVLKRARSTDSTNFENALQEAIDIFEDTDTASGNRNMVFISDGEPTDEGSYSTLADYLRGTLEVNSVAIGVGTGSSRSALELIDPDATVYADANTLREAILYRVPTTGAFDKYVERTQSGVVVYLDENNNLQLDWHDRNQNNRWDEGEGEHWTTSQDDDPSTPDVDETGRYTIGEVGLGYTGALMRQLTPDSPQSTFGRSVSVSGQHAIVGSWDDTFSGTAFLFDTATGQQLHELVPDSEQVSWDYGVGVAVNGGNAIVTDRYAWQFGASSGIAYLFDAESGEQLSELVPDDGVVGTDFGVRVVIDHDLAVISDMSWGEGNERGAVYVFNIANPRTPFQVAKLLPEIGSGDNRFGWDLDIQGNIVVVGSPNTDQPGSAYLYDLSDLGGPIQLARLTDTDGYNLNDPSHSDGYGTSVSLGGLMLAVGSPNAIDDPDKGFAAGAVFTYTIANPSDPIFARKYVPSDTRDTNRFGHSVAVDGHALAVGYPDRPIAESQIDYHHSTVNVYNTITGERVASIRKPAGTNTGYFGAELDFTDNTLLVGGDLSAGGAYLYHASEYKTNTRSANLRQIAPAGYVSTDPADGAHNVSISRFSDRTGIQFGNAPLASGPTIDVGTIDLLPNTPGQRVTLYIEGAESITGFALKAQIGDGIGPDNEPIFTAVDFTGTIWDSYATDIVGGPEPGAPQYAQSTVTFQTQGDQVTATGPLVVLEFDTTGILTPGLEFDLKLAGTDIGVDSSLIKFSGETVVPHIVNGRIRMKADALVVDQHVFYNGSYFDSGSTDGFVSDDAAIAIDKVALQTGEAASINHYTSFFGGLNGIMVDIDSLADPNSVTPTDFVFRSGNSDDRPAWRIAPSPHTVHVREGAGSGGSDRISLIWNNNNLDSTLDPFEAVASQWLEVTVLATERTGLSENFTFYYGNAPGETGNVPTNTFVDGTDYAFTRDNPHNFLDRATIDDVYDHNRDSFVDGVDLSIIRDNPTNFLTDLVLIDLSTALAEQPILQADPLAFELAYAQYVWSFMTQTAPAKTPIDDYDNDDTEEEPPILFEQMNYLMNDEWQPSLLWKN